MIIICILSAWMLRKTFPLSLSVCACARVRFGGNLLLDKNGREIFYLRKHHPTSQPTCIIIIRFPLRPISPYGKHKHRKKWRSGSLRKEFSSRQPSQPNLGNISEITKGIFMPLCQLIAVLRESGQEKPSRPKWIARKARIGRFDRHWLSAHNRYTLATENGFDLSD